MQALKRYLSLEIENSRDYLLKLKYQPEIYSKGSPKYFTIIIKHQITLRLEQLLESSKGMGYNMSFKIYFLNLHLDFFLGKFVVASDKQDQIKGHFSYKGGYRRQWSTRILADRYQTLKSAITDVNIGAIQQL